MLGNDVVDLAAAAAPRHARFDARAFCAAERDAIAASADPEGLRWTMWAAKESAFKALARAGGIRFVPRRFAVTPAERPSGATVWMRVVQAAGHARVRVERCDRFLHAVAWSDGELAASTLCGIARADDVAAGSTPRQAVRALARARIADALELEAGELEIAREGRVPRVAWRGAPLPGVLSLSHHGDFVAFAFRLARDRS